MDKLWSRPPISMLGWTNNFSNRHFQRPTFLSAKAKTRAIVGCSRSQTEPSARAGRHTDRRCPAGSLAMPVGRTLAADCGLRGQEAEGCKGWEGATTEGAGKIDGG